MVLSKRERAIVIATLLCVGLLVGDKFIYAPVETKLSAMQAERDDLRAELTEGEALIQQHKVLGPRWAAIVKDGLRSDAEAESRIGRAIEDWSGRTRLTLSSIKPDRVAAGEQGLNEMTFIIAGEGTLESVARFLMLVETDALPVRIKSMSLSSPSEAGNVMRLDLTVSALYLGESRTQNVTRPEAEDENELL